MQGDVSVSTENSIDVPRLGVSKRAIHDSRCHARPFRIQAIDKSREALTLAIKFLNDVLVEEVAEANQEGVTPNERVELVSVNGQVPLAHVFPDEALIYRNANEV